VTVPIPVDAEGLQVSEGERLAHDAKLAMVTPSHQYPLGVTMSLRRRLALLDWARRASAWILEDDYDSEFRYEGPPFPPLASLAGAGQVIYAGTFSKALAPGLRLGYLVVPPSLAEAFSRARGLADRQAPILPQMILAEFIHEGHLAAHVRRMRKLYHERRDELLRLLEQHVPDALRADQASCGLHLVGHLPRAADDRLLSERALIQGLQTPALSNFYQGRAAMAGLVIGFASTGPTQVESAVQSLAGILRPEVAA
jgi:GntR family transcriptional regulator/MocR family aminotransferase